jgi:glycosyltransferase involved in cell wall biosynthesis
MEKYTIVIPTRDRAETLEATLRTCVRQTYKNLEIIVSDNCSADNTKQIVENFQDPRIRYINPGRRLSMSGNFEFALGHVKDGFVMFIGSDDGVMPDAVEYVRSIVEKHGVSAVACRQATYVWPNFPDKNIAGRMIFGGWRDDVEIRKSPEWIDRTLSFRATYCFDLPNLYCGFVHKRVIDKAYKDGSYFKSITPDAYSAFATAIFTDEYAFSHRPFSMAGASVKSNGAAGLNPAADIKEAIKFREENDIELADGFVECPSFEVILAETFAKLSQAFPERCAPYHINYGTMLHQALSNVNQKTEETVSAAVAEMARNFGVNMDDSPEKVGKWERLRVGKISDLLRVMVRPAKVVAVERSAEIGIRDVDDAVVVAHALRHQNGGSDSFITSRGYVIKKLKQLAGITK